MSSSEKAHDYNDSMLQRWSILVDEIRTELADLQEQKQVPALVKLRHYLNWSLRAMADADMELAE